MLDTIALNDVVTKGRHDGASLRAAWMAEMSRMAESEAAHERVDALVSLTRAHEDEVAPRIQAYRGADLVRLHRTIGAFAADL